MSHGHGGHLAAQLRAAVAHPAVRAVPSRGAFTLRPSAPPLHTLAVCPASRCDVDARTLPHPPRLRSCISGDGNTLITISYFSGRLASFQTGWAGLWRKDGAGEWFLTTVVDNPVRQYYLDAPVVTNRDGSVVAFYANGGSSRPGAVVVWVTGASFLGTGLRVFNISDTGAPSDDDGFGSALSMVRWGRAGMPVSCETMMQSL